MADFPIIGIGASAGGLEALERFFEAVPSDCGMAFVVIQHLSPDYKSLMPELLSKRTSMTVLRAEDGVRIEPNHAYLISPRHNLTIYHDRLYLTQQDHDRGLNLPIDIFLRSLAEDQGSNAVGIILSGTGSDGMRGVRAIKEADGIVMVQDEATAKFDGMPRSAMSTGLVDFELPPEEMPRQLINYLERPAGNVSEDQQVKQVSDDDELMKVIAHLRKNTGLDFAYYKPNMIVRRIERRMSINQVGRLSDYVEFIRSSSDETDVLCRELLIGVTNFFRDPEAFESLYEKALPKLFPEDSPPDSLRCWIAGCSTGEEAYSIAILLQEYIERENLSCEVKIFATDADRNAIEIAGNGIYPESIAADVNPERLARWFQRKGGSYQISRSIREKVVFAPHNVMKDPPFTKVDFLSCRNLLIYIEPRTQQRILSLFGFSLRHDGILFLGKSESIGDLSQQFQAVDSKWKIYQNVSHTRVSLADTLPLAMNTPRIRTHRFHANGLSTQTQSGDYLEPVFQSIIEEYAPPCVVVDENQTVLHLFGDTGLFVKVPAGRATLNLPQMVGKRLGTALGIALHKASRHDKDVVYRDIYLDGMAEGEARRVHLRVRPVNNKRGRKKPLYLVFFESEEAPDKPSETSETFDGSTGTEQRVQDLEQELQQSRENLQATIEELETSNEELQATNEELLASNEELQSTNEELQSVNEELYTVNAEYQSKIQQLTDLNNDMDNLLLSTDIGTLFLDRDMTIRKFTNPVGRYMNILAQDVGRPVSHINHRLQYDDFMTDARQCLESGKDFEREVATQDGEWVLLGMRPYQTSKAGSHGGVVISLVDITAIKRVEEELRRERDLLDQVMQATENGVLVLDVDGNAVFANSQALKMLGLEKNQVVGTPFGCEPLSFRDSEGRPVSAEASPLQKALVEAESMRGLCLLFDAPGQTDQCFLVNALPLERNNDLGGGMVVTFRPCEDGSASN